MSLNLGATARDFLVGREDVATALRFRWLTVRRRAEVAESMVLDFSYSGVEIAPKMPCDFLSLLFLWTIYSKPNPRQFAVMASSTNQNFSETHLPAQTIQDEFIQFYCREFLKGATLSRLIRVLGLQDVSFSATQMSVFEMLMCSSVARPHLRRLHSIRWTAFHHWMGTRSWPERLKIRPQFLRVVESFSKLLSAEFQSRVSKPTRTRTEEVRRRFAESFASTIQMPDLPRQQQVAGVKRSFIIAFVA
jgi:hypothetical protein